MHNYCCFTNDVETTSIRTNELLDSVGELVLKEGLPILLELYKKYNVKSTFFFVGNTAKKFPDMVRMIIPFGHEVACHGFTHEFIESFDMLDLDDQINHLDKAKKILEDISGQKVVTFRAPALRVNKFTATALEKTGFYIDSSVAAQRFDLFLSHGSKEKLKWLFAPRKIYRTSHTSLLREGTSNIYEVPISAIFLPYIGTTMRIFPNISRGVRAILSTETQLRKYPINFLIHPNEFIDEINNQKAVRRSKNIVGYLLGDLLRNKLKIKNLGKIAAPLFEEQIRYFTERGFKFDTLRNFIDNNYKNKLN